MEIAAHGFDTLRPDYDFEQGLPWLDKEWQGEMLSQGFRSVASSHLDYKTGEVVESQSWLYQDPKNSTLRFQLRNGRYLTSEFSAPRLLDDSPVNLRLASPTEAAHVLEDVGKRAEKLIPGASTAVLLKLTRADYACDLYAESTAPGVIAAGGQLQLAGARKVTKQLHPQEGAILRSQQQTFRTYLKSLELSHKLTPKQRQEHATTIQYAKDRGLTRMEHMNRPRKAMSLEYLDDGPQVFADRLRQGFPDGGKIYIGGLHKIRAQVDALDQLKVHVELNIKPGAEVGVMEVEEWHPVAAQRKNSLLAFAYRYSVLGHEGMKAAYSERTFYRQKKQFEAAGLCLDDITEFHGEVDFNPVIHQLRAA